MQRSVVVFVASCLLGAWSALLVYESPPAWLATTFTWVAGWLVGYSSSLPWWHDTSSETNPRHFESAELLRIVLLGKRKNDARGN